MSSSFGRLFKVSTWGESHGPAIGAVVDGCPAGLLLNENDIQTDLDRRRPGQGHLTSPRQEADRVRILSGVFEGYTIGSPISLQIENTNAKPEEYQHLKNTFRPGHADYTYQAKYGRRDWRGGGRASARETAARVAAGAIARKLLAEEVQVEVIAWVSAIGSIEIDIPSERVSREILASSPVCCPVPSASKEMEERIVVARAEKDTLGGIISVEARNVPVGWGEPVFDKLEAELAKALMSIPAVKGFEVGAGFSGARLPGSQHNDPFFMTGDRVRTRSNRSGGIQGGISNGETVFLRTAFKPVSTLPRKQESIGVDGGTAWLEPKGRHDVCVLPRAVPIVEAMVLLVLADQFLQHRARSRRL